MIRRRMTGRWFSCNFDTVGEFVGGAWNGGFAFPEAPILPIFRPNDPRREFANVSKVRESPFYALSSTMELSDGVVTELANAGSDRGFLRGLYQASELLPPRTLL